MANGAYFTETQPTRCIRWICAAVVAIVLHAGAALALFYARVENDADPPGAIAVELAPITTAPPFAPTEVPPDQMMQEDAAAREARKQIAENVAEVVPRVAPAPLAPEPTLQLPDPQPEKKVQVDDKTAPEQKSQQAFSVNDLSAASRRCENHRCRSRPAGLSTVTAKSQAAWQKSLVAHINRHKRYPAEASAHKKTGIATVEFMLDRRGQVLSTRVAQSSGSAILDEEAVGLLRRAAPLPIPPRDVPQEGILLAVPIHFRMD